MSHVLEGTTPDARGIASAIDQLRDSIDDATSEHDILNIVAYALRTDRAGELETHLEPLVQRWLDESMEGLVVDEQTREDAIAGCQVGTLEAYRTTVL